MTRHTRTQWMFLAGGLVLALACDWALGKDRWRAPTVDGGIPWKSIAVIAACLAGMALSIFKNAKRSHQSLN